MIQLAKYGLYNIPLYTQIERDERSDSELEEISDELTANTNNSKPTKNGTECNNSEPHINNMNVAKTMHLDTAINGKILTKKIIQEHS